jgi:GrpB-like predicted nucleotidyltransferase (UPF0157 family)
MIGLSRDRVQLVPYQASWPLLFEDEAHRLRRALGNALGQIQHVGSTAVPGLSAKPIIDMLATVQSLPLAQTLLSPLAQLGYEHRPAAATATRLFFALGPTPCRTHYLSLTEVGSPTWNEQLLFRDHLRTHSDTRKAYSALKDSLAQRFPMDRPAYTAAKGQFIQTILRSVEG